MKGFDKEKFDYVSKLVYAALGKHNAHKPSYVNSIRDYRFAALVVTQINDELGSYLPDNERHHFQAHIMTQKIGEIITYLYKNIKIDG